MVKKENIHVGVLARAYRKEKQNWTLKDRLFIDYIGQEMMSFLEKIYKYGKK